MLLDVRNETASTGRALKSIKTILVWPGPDKSHFAEGLVNCTCQFRRIKCMIQISGINRKII